MQVKWNRYDRLNPDTFPPTSFGNCWVLFNSGFVTEDRFKFEKPSGWQSFDPAIIGWAEMIKPESPSAEELEELKRPAEKVTSKKKTKKEKGTYHGGR